MTVTTDSPQTQDEAQIRLIADEASAICAKDIDHHVLLRPRCCFLRCEAAVPNQWCRCLAPFGRCLPYFPDSFGIESRDLSIIVSGDLAIAHWLNRFTGMEPNHPAMQTAAVHHGLPSATGQMVDAWYGRRSIRTRLKPIHARTLAAQNL